MKTTIHATSAVMVKNTMKGVIKPLVGKHCCGYCPARRRRVKLKFRKSGAGGRGVMSNGGPLVQFNGHPPVSSYWY